MAKENENDRYESCESCISVGVSPGNKNVYRIIETDSDKGCRISILANYARGEIIREIRLSNRGKLESYFDSNLGAEI